MQTTDKVICRELINLLVKHGIKDIILSPGTRNAPLIMTVARNANLRSHVVVDERSAAFVALGMSSLSQTPVGLICTSGSAMLNYAPALAEAFYREVPLIVITADRPAEWIDQDDCQTIHQPFAYGKLVKMSVDIPDDNSAKSVWYANRQINDAISCACSGRKGPVHINIQLDAPLTNVCDIVDESSRFIETISPEPLVSTSLARELALNLKSPTKILIVVGFNAPNQKLNRALSKLSRLPNVAIIAEAQSNVHIKDAVRNIESIFSVNTPEMLCDLAPNLVVTIGGSVLSQSLKRWLRDMPNLQHWHVGVRGYAVDCFKHLVKRIELPAETFMGQLASGAMPFKSYQSDYQKRWSQYSAQACLKHSTFVKNEPWSDLIAVDKIISRLPNKCNLQISNGTAVRYVQLCNFQHLHRVDCNRGVSGIDGSTSTAVGASLAYDGITVLLTGDMSAQYDIGALAIHDIPSRLKIIVLDNDGGSIFRMIKPTRSLPECEDFLAAKVHLPLKQLADGFGFSFYDVSNLASLDDAMPDFLAESDKPAIMAVHTCGKTSADVFRKYLTQFKQK